MAGHSGKTRVVPPGQSCRLGLLNDCTKNSLITALEKDAERPQTNQESVVVCTDKQESMRLAELIKASSKLMKSGPPTVYKLPLDPNNIGIDGCKSYTFGKHSERPNRTVMFLGETGAGKSTLINGMINYILGIDWKDSFRFKLIDEGQLKSQAESQTSHVTAYKVNHQVGFKVPYSLTFIDTPGFCDTQGIEKDKMITEQIRRLFTSGKGVSEIDAICFVTPASVARLTPTQKYIFDSVLSIFGKDVAENICMLVTFADSQQPPVLEAINASEVPCPKTGGLPLHYKFNNSVLFADNRSDLDRPNEDSDEDMEVDKFAEKCWTMGTKSMRKFFTALDKMTTQSLQLTKEVLNKRKQLEVTVEGVQPQVRVKLAKLEKNELLTEEHDRNITSNKSFQSEVEILKPVKVTNKGESMTNNQQWPVTSHHSRVKADDEAKRGCASMKVPGIRADQGMECDGDTEAKITDQKLIENQEDKIKDKEYNIDGKKRLYCQIL